MKIPLLLMAGLAASASCALADSVVLFRDTFEVSEPSFDVNFDNDQGRQTGSLAPLTYTQVENAPEKSQLGNPGNPEALLLAAFGASGGNISPDASFTTTAGPGGYQYIKFKVRACGPGSSEDVNTDSWVSVAFGKTTQNAYVVSASGGGAIFRGNGNFQSFTGGAATGDGVYTENFDDYTPVELRFIDAADGNAFDGSADPVTIELYANDPPELLYSWESETNFTENHISLGCSVDGGVVAAHYVDDFEIGVQTTTAAGAPVILTEPSRVVVFPQQTATFSVVAGGAAPLSYQWRRNGTDLAGATQSSLTLPEVAAADDGEYTVVVSNAQNSITSAVAALSVVNPLPAVFGTGVDNSGLPLPAYVLDPHYRLISTPDGEETIPAVVQDAALTPIVTGPWTNASPASRWIGPAPDTGAAAAGEYVYEVTFSLDGFDPATALISGRWATDNDGVDIRLNGQPTGQTNTAQFAEYTTFTLGSGFKAGLNTLEFVVSNADTGYTGLKAEILFAGAKTAAAPANATPLIIGRPQPVLGIAGETVALEVLASGIPAVTFQWSKDGAPIAGATAARLEPGALSAAAAGAYTVTVTNSAGSITSDPATVTVLAAVPGLFNTGVDAAGQALADEEADPHYTLTESANGGDGTAFAVSNIPQPEWLVNSETSRWIGPVPSGSSEAGSYTYSITFDLTGFDSSTAVLRGSIASDDLLTGVLLNGVDSRRRNALPGYSPLREFTLTEGFVEGMNTLDFVVNNAGAAANPSGLRIDGLRAGAVATAVSGDQPVLSIAPAEAGQVRLSWPVAGGAGWTLYRSSNLSTWNAVTAAPVEAGGQFSVTTPLTQEPVAREFFRLQK